MITALPESTGRLLGFRLTGKLHDEDYQHFVPVVDAAIAEHRRVRILSEFVDFQGWDLHALWDDTKFSMKHCSEVEKIALVGDRAWEKWMAAICKPFTHATVEYFDVQEIDRAWVWLAE